MRCLIVETVVDTVNGIVEIYRFNIAACLHQEQILRNIQWPAVRGEGGEFRARVDQVLSGWTLAKPRQARGGD